MRGAKGVFRRCDLQDLGYSVLKPVSWWTRIQCKCKNKKLQYIQYMFMFAYIEPENMSTLLSMQSRNYQKQQP